MKRVIWSIEAQADLDDFDREFAEWSPEYADRVGLAALAAGRFLGRYPQAGPAFDGRLRKWRVASTDYVIVYRVVADEVQILRLHHARRDWRPARRRE